MNLKLIYSFHTAQYQRVFSASFPLPFPPQAYMLYNQPGSQFTGHWRMSLPQQGKHSLEMTVLYSRPSHDGPGILFYRATHEATQSAYGEISSTIIFFVFFQFSSRFDPRRYFLSVVPTGQRCFYYIRPSRYLAESFKIPS